MPLPSSFDDFVIDVSDIHNMFHIIAKVFAKDPSNDVQSEIRPCMAHVRMIVDSGTANVEFHLKTRNLRNLINGITISLFRLGINFVFNKTKLFKDAPENAT